MFDLSLPVSELPIMSPGENDDYFNQHYPQWEQEVIDKLASMGYPAELWPSDDFRAKGFVRFWKATGQPRNAVPINAPMDKTPYDGPRVPDSVAKMFNTSFPHVMNAMFCITKGEDWWPYDKAFICNDANSYMRFILHTVATMDPKIMEKPAEKKLGRPRNEAAHAAKAEKSSRYQQWLADCEVYRAEVAEAEEAYSQARAVAEDFRAALNKIKVRGAPKWIP